MITIKDVLFELEWMKKRLSYVEKSGTNKIWLEGLEKDIEALEKRLVDELQDKEIK